MSRCAGGIDPANFPNRFLPWRLVTYLTQEHEKKVMFYTHTDKSGRGQQGSH